MKMDVEPVKREFKNWKQRHAAQRPLQEALIEEIGGINPLEVMTQIFSPNLPNTTSIDPGFRRNLTRRSRLFETGNVEEIGSLNPLNAIQSTMKIPFVSEVGVANTRSRRSRQFEIANIEKIGNNLIQNPLMMFETYSAPDSSTGINRNYKLALSERFLPFNVANIEEVEEQNPFIAFQSYLEPSFVKEPGIYQTLPRRNRQFDIANTEEIEEHNPLNAIFTYPQRGEIPNFELQRKFWGVPSRYSLPSIGYQMEQEIPQSTDFNPLEMIIYEAPKERVYREQTEVPKPSRKRKFVNMSSNQNPGEIPMGREGPAPFLPDQPKMDAVIYAKIQGLEARFQALKKYFLFGKATTAHSSTIKKEELMNIKKEINRLKSQFK